MSNMESKQSTGYVIDPNAYDIDKISDNQAVNIPVQKAKAKVLDEVEISIKRWKELKKMAKTNPQHQFVILIGKATVAKTVITATLNYTANTKFGTHKNMSNLKGVKYINQVIEEMSTGKFPSATRVNYIDYYTTTILFKDQELPLTFIEMSGEDLSMFDSTTDSEMNEVAKQLTKFMKVQPNLMTFLVAPANDASNNDSFLHNCICRFHDIHPDLVNKMGVIISKWDLLHHSQKKNSARSFAKENLPATYAWLTKRAQHRLTGFYPFSVGNVISENAQDGTGHTDKIHNGISTKYAIPILLWIKKLLVDWPREVALNEILKGDLQVVEKMDQSLQVASDQNRVDLESIQPSQSSPKGKGAKSKFFNWPLL